LNLIKNHQKNEQFDNYDFKNTYIHLTFSSKNMLENAMKSPLKSLALLKREYLDSDPKLFASQVPVGSGSKTQRKFRPGFEKIVLKPQHCTVLYSTVYNMPWLQLTT
jgi:hypothetical protein